ncbi:MAG: peroxide stress protein YaaA [Acidimicrobiales bacterium]
MLIVLSPAKSLDEESPLTTKKWSEPRLLDQSDQLVEVLRDLAPADLSALMSISPDLAELNHERYQEYHRPFTPDNARPAVLMFSGDVYQGLDANATFSERDFTHAQKTLRILSGLYGVLRPLDLIQPYRLEMGSKLENPRGKDLYAFWGDRIADRLNADLRESPGPAVLVNLASNEYFSSVDTDRLEARIVTPSFLDSKDGKDPKIISFFAKRARGAMAGWLIQNRVKTLKALQQFDGLDYAFDPDRSTPSNPVYVRYH